MSAKLGISLAALLSMAACCEEGDLQCVAERAERLEEIEKDRAERAAKRQEKLETIAAVETQYGVIATSVTTQDNGFNYTLLDRHNVVSNDGITPLVLNFTTGGLSTPAKAFAGQDIDPLSHYRPEFVDNAREKACEIASTAIANLSPQMTQNWIGNEVDKSILPASLSITFTTHNKNMPKAAAKDIYDDALAFNEAHCNDITPN